jgi:hypothetical protein
LCPSKSTYNDSHLTKVEGAAGTSFFKLCFQAKRMDFPFTLISVIRTHLYIPRYSVGPHSRRISDINTCTNNADTRPIANADIRAIPVDGNGWSWIASICTYTVLLRSALIPIHISSLKQTNRIKSLKPWLTLLSTTQPFNHSHRLKSGLRPKLNLYHIPVLIVSSLSIRSHSTDMGLDYSTSILPLSITAFNLLNIQINHSRFSGVFALFSFCTLPILFSMPSSVCYYWVTSSGFTFIQSLVSRTSFVKRLIRV